MLYIVPTPIGNLKDITLRSLEVLRSVEGVVCEDTRRTKILLEHYNIQKPLFTLNDFNESVQRSKRAEKRALLGDVKKTSFVVDQILENLKAGKDLALVSDAGTPLISDPGYKLIRTCLTEKIHVDALPGPTAPITALTSSGFPPDKFMFIGYLPEKPGQRANMLSTLTTIYQLQPLTFIAFVAPHKVVKTIEGMQESFGDIEICLAKELTKMYQQVSTKKISAWLEQYKKAPPKGEYVLIFRPE